MKETVEKKSTEFFEKMGIHIESLNVTQEKDHIFSVGLQSDDSALLIGNRGQTLIDIKRVLGLILSRTLETKIIVHVEVNNYLEEKDKRLFQFIDDKIELCRKLGKDLKLPYFSPYERKKIHNYISEKAPKNLSTRSEGEGKERRLFLCLEKEKMTIDIDGVEI